MKLKFYFYLIGSVLVLNTFSLVAQENIIIEDTLPQPVDTSFKKNEIGLDLSQWVVFFLGGDAPPNFEIHYKRHFKKNKALRLGFEYVPNDVATITILNDSTNTSNIITNEINNKIFIKAGLEWQTWLNEFTLFYGIDLAGGKNEATTTFSKYYPDTVLKSSYFIKETSTSQTSNIKAGIIPFAGVNFTISNRISLSIQGGFSILYNTGITTVTDYKNEVSTTSYGELDFRMDPIINNFSLNFRF